MDRLGELVAAAQARRDAIPEPPADPGRDAPAEHHEQAVARTLAQARIARLHHEAAVLEYRELVALMHHLRGVEIPRALDDIEICRRDAFHAVRRAVPFTEGEARTAMIQVEKSLRQPFRGDDL